MMPLGNSLLDEKTVDSLSKTDETELPSGGCCANDSPTKKDNDDSKDHYAVLNLPQDASVEEIKKRYAYIVKKTSAEFRRWSKKRRMRVPFHATVDVINTYDCFSVSFLIC